MSRRERGETFSIPVTLTQPEETKQSLEAKLFRDLLGEGTTNVGGSSSRKHNVKLSAPGLQRGDPDARGGVLP